MNNELKKIWKEALAITLGTHLTSVWRSRVKPKLPVLGWLFSRASPELGTFQIWSRSTTQTIFGLKILEAHNYKIHTYNCSPGWDLNSGHPKYQANTIFGLKILEAYNYKIHKCNALHYLYYIDQNNGHWHFNRKLLWLSTSLLNLEHRPYWQNNLCACATSFAYITKLSKAPNFVNLKSSGMTASFI